MKLQIEEITQINGPEEFKLTVKVTSHQAPEPQDYFYDESEENLERMCSFLENITISGSWYTPGQPYTKDQLYVDKTKVPEVMGGYGIAILSTSKGILTDEACRREGVGGEVLCNIW